ncbi:unnamed protein product [Rotaria sordida]|uniref:F-box domain-containing protein n=1 Tax=Rotaria sordida TaxID=392033 RepID=A0A813WN78_9BILA|nr:unnamed protein product [Rotaria sordida]
MTNNINLSIEKLPVELLHRIFDNIDAETIFFSIRSVCRLFQSVVKTFDRFILNFQSISKSNFYKLCRSIDPKNVISLTLSNEIPKSNQIFWSISLVYFQQFTRLRSITFHDIDEAQFYTNNLTSICFLQLTSLTIKNLCQTIDEFQSFLLLTPSLTYLKCINGRNMIDGKRWEQFIEQNLFQLDKFEFYFHERRSITEQPYTDLELIIDSFRTSFWIEKKKWFVTCEYDMSSPETIYLYTIPICQSYMNYVSKSETNSLSTYSMIMNNDSSIISKTSSLKFTLNKSLANDIQEKKVTTNHRLFPKVTKLSLQFQKDWPIGIV